METVTSKDGTSIAYDQLGQGPAVVLVGGGMTTRGDQASLANALASHSAVYNFDRRGRGDSGNTLPFAVEREIEDIAAVIDAAGGTAYLYGISSGGALALRAAAQLSQVKKLALYEVPFSDDPEAQRNWKQYVTNLTGALDRGDRGEAVATFLRLVGMPDENIAGMRGMPMWAGMEAIAPTLGSVSSLV
jgi:pimeloyl-ACP methyl ester carboxylesterase